MKRKLLALMMAMALLLCGCGKNQEQPQPTQGQVTTQPDKTLVVGTLNFDGNFLPFSIPMPTKMRF